MNPLRIVYAGTPEFAVPALKSLAQAGHQLLAVYTQPDRPVGRGRQLRPTPVKAAALALGIPVHQPLSLKDPDVLSALADYAPDVMVVAAYGLLLPQAVLGLPRYGCLNIHASLLPRWRGAAPIQRAIEAGDQLTGVTIMQMETGLDTGPMLAKNVIPIEAEDTAGSIHDRLAELGAQTLLDVLEELAMECSRAEPQDPAQACYARKLTKAEALVSWNRPAIEIVRKIQAFNPWPVAETRWKGQSLRLYEARVGAAFTAAEPGQVVAESAAGIDVAAGGGEVRILNLQLPGRRIQTAAEFINGYSLLGQTFVS